MSVSVCSTQDAVSRSLVENLELAKACQQPLRSHTSSENKRPRIVKSVFINCVRAALSPSTRFRRADCTYVQRCQPLHSLAACVYLSIYLSIHLYVYIYIYMRKATSVSLDVEPPPTLNFLFMALDSCSASLLECSMTWLRKNRSIEIISAVSSVIFNLRISFHTRRSGSNSSRTEPQDAGHAVGMLSGLQVVAGDGHVLMIFRGRAGLVFSGKTEGLSLSQWCSHYAPRCPLLQQSSKCTAPP